MKRKLLAFTISFLVVIVSLVTPIFGAVGHHWLADYTESAAYNAAGVTIDGKQAAGEWDEALPYGILVSNDDPATAAVGIPDSNYKDDGNYYFKWDDKGLYILEVRNDKELDYGGTAEAPWETDGSLVFVQVADDDSGINSRDASIHIFYILGNGDGAIGGQLCYRYAFGEDSSTSKTIDDGSLGGKIAVSTTSTGWIAEVYVPWSVFQQDVPNWKPAANAELGLNFVPHDAGESGAEAQLVWVKQHEAVGLSNNDFGGWGVLKLLEEPPAEEIIEESGVTESPAVAAPGAASPATNAPSTGSPAATVTAPQTFDPMVALVILMVCGIFGAVIIGNKFAANR